MLTRRNHRGLFPLLLCFSILALSLRAQTNQTIYSEALSNSWSVGTDWAVVNLANTSPVHTGTKSISATCQGASYEGLYFQHGNFDTTPYSAFSFWINGGTGGQPVWVQGTINYTGQMGYPLARLPTNTWVQYTIPLSALGVSNTTINGFWIQSQSGSTLPTFYVDDVVLIANTNTTVVTNATNVINVDAAANRHSISPLIYGVAFATAAQMSDLNATLNRCGGDAETRYNWQTNAHNRGGDYFYESIADSSTTVAGQFDDQFVSNTKTGGGQPILTVPMIGWSPKLGANRSTIASYSVAKYGPQTSSDGDHGNGISTTNSTPITWNDPTDANFVTDSTFQKGWIQHLTNIWGTATNSGVKYYCMDNETSLWFELHQDVHPVGATMQEIRNKFFDYAGMVKSVDSNALIFAPEEWGWSGYFYSGYDQQWSGANNDYNAADFPDRSTNGGMDFAPWFLSQLHQQASNTNQRLLDYFSLHFYPQGGEFSNDTSPATQQLRNRSTRDLWDTNYVDTSWINSVVALIPRMQSWVAQYYPGTKVALTEYNWGAEGSINGATAQADILGILGRQNIDLATRWTAPTNGSPVYLAMKMYRNYDGNKSTFGDTSISAGGPNPDTVATFAAERSSDGALTIMVISKSLSGVVPVSVNVTNFAGIGTAQVWQLNSTNAIARFSDLSYGTTNLNLTVPGQSITLLVFPAKPLTLQLTTRQVQNEIQFSLIGQVSNTYVLQFSTNLTSWLAVATNTLTNAQWNLVLPTTALAGFYRARLNP